MSQRCHPNWDEWNRGFVTHTEAYPSRPATRVSSVSYGSTCSAQEIKMKQRKQFIDYVNALLLIQHNLKRWYAAGVYHAFSWIVADAWLCWLRSLDLNRITILQTIINWDFMSRYKLCSLCVCVCAVVWFPVSVYYWKFELLHFIPALAFGGITPNMVEAKDKHFDINHTVANICFYCLLLLHVAYTIFHPSI